MCAGRGGGMAAVDYHQPCSGRWLQSLCSSHSRWLQWLWPSHLTQNGCDIASSAMRARPGAGGMAAAARASSQPSLLRMVSCLVVCVSLLCDRHRPSSVHPYRDRWCPSRWSDCVSPSQVPINQWCTPTHGVCNSTHGVCNPSRTSTLALPHALQFRYLTRDVHIGLCAG